MRVLQLSSTWLSDFFAELNRRKVVKVALVYVVISFGAMEVGGNFFPALRLPEYAQTLLAAFLILGLPIAIALAWVFEVTPSGIQLEVERAVALSKQGGEPIAQPSATVLRLAPEPVWSIAVLPFADLSPERNQGFFVEGVAEEIRHCLSRVEGLSIVARCSSLAFRDASIDVREIGRLLGVSSVLEGSLRKWENRFIITTQLISVADGFEIWSDRYDGAVEDIFNVQTRIAGAIIAAVAPRLRSTGPIIRGSTTDPQAHRAFLKGRHLCNSRNPDDLDRAIRYFGKAIEASGDYAAAHVGLADAYGIMARLGYARPIDVMPRARSAVLSALAIDPSLAAAHKSYAVILHRFDGDRAAAEVEFRLAVELNPGYASARYWLGEFLLLTGRVQEAIEMLELAQDVDPVSTVGSAHLVIAYTLAGQDERAARQAEDALALNPHSAAAHCDLGLLHHWQGRDREALDILEQAHLIEPQSPEIMVARAVVYAGTGRTAEASAIRDELHASGERRWSRQYHEAAISAALGDHERALAALADCYAERVFDCVRITIDPAFASLQADPRLARLRTAHASLSRGSVPAGLTMPTKQPGRAFEHAELEGTPEPALTYLIGLPARD
jgi:TolB-like protein/tetratricopeptide (TPR) repeat protein